MGDHQDLGAAIARGITRVGSMRDWTIGLDNRRHSTLEEGPDPSSKFIDAVQSDDRPQKITLKLFPVGTGGNPQPHPVFSGPDGPISCSRTTGMKVRPSCPRFNRAIQTGQPETVTRKGRISLLSAEPRILRCCPKEFGLVSVYNGHNVEVGRILADSSWHHWLDENLEGTPSAPYDGLDATIEGRKALKKIEAYFLNCGVWLAPPNIQIQMRNTAWWSILWTDRIGELPVTAPLDRLGKQALDSLTLYASAGFASEWIINRAILKQGTPQGSFQLAEQLHFLGGPLELFIAGGILRQLMLRVGPAVSSASFPNRPTAGRRD